MQDVAAVVIGRNEGARLMACLASLQGQVTRIVYVDSGSTDGSVEQARAQGVEVITLDMTRPFTAARARNVGLSELANTQARFVQFVDGDCIVAPDWIATGRAFLEAHPKAAVACGRRREINPEASIYNRLCDREWNTPVGEALACGGDALMRRDAVQAVGGYSDDLIAGEEPELCQRLRRAGWSIWRLDAEMTQHDAQMTRFSQWWARSRRAGYAFAEGAALHGAGPDRHWVAEARRSLAWGGALPIIAVAASLITPEALFLLLLYPLQMLRLWRRDKDAGYAVLTVLGKIPEATGAMRYHLDRVLGRKSGLIEYR